VKLRVKKPKSSIHLLSYLLRNQSKEDIYLKRNPITITAVLAGLVLLISACGKDSPPSSTSIEPGSRLVADTIAITDIDIREVGGYTGNLSNVSFGAYDDQAFGEIEASALWKPIFITVDRVDTLTNNEQFYLSFSISSQYGDTAGTGEFEIYEIAQYWRATSWRPDSVLVTEQNPITSFTISQQDSIAVPLPSAWSDKYVEYYRNRFDSTLTNSIDTLYRDNFHGLAIRPANNQLQKVVAANTSSMKMLISNQDTTYEVATQKTATKFARNAEPTYSDEGKVALHGTYERMLGFDFGLTTEDFLVINGREIPSKSIARFEVVFHRDTETLDATLPQNHRRPGNSRYNIFSTDPNTLFYAIVGSPLYAASYDEGKGTYRLNLTNLANSIILGGEQTEERYYAVPVSGDGIIRSDLTYLPDHPEKFPKIIVTYAVSDEN
jgi:hypothetical protein